MKKIAIAGFSHETNTFSPLATPFDVFEFTTKEEIEQSMKGRINSGAVGFAHRGSEFEFDCVPLVFATTNPSNQVQIDAFERIMAMILEALKEQGPFDGVYLDLHGAMVIEDYRDGETEILRQIREVVGDIPVVGSLDLHGNIHIDSIKLSTGLISCREYPHIDMYETGERCAVLMQHVFEGKPLFKAFRQVPFITVLSTMSTFVEPCKSLYAQIEEVEKDSELISASIMEGFPPADVEHCGPTVFAYGITQAAADTGADKLYQAWLDVEDQITSDLPGAKEAVEMAIKLAAEADKPVILSDVLDNPGGGSTSDTVWLLEELYKQKAPKTAIGLIFDPEAAAEAHQAGEGAEVKLKVGGKLMPGHQPFEKIFKVEKLFDGIVVGTGPLAKGWEIKMGKMAYLRIDGLHLVVGSYRIQAADQAMFTVLGLNPAEMEILVLKSSNHFRADFEPISSSIHYVAAPAAMVEDPAKVDYKNLREGVRLGGNGPVFKKVDFTSST
ncbi:MAG: M81 family metallopeptidase [Anaerolineaceae bacterium]|nr:M81 family metallopeptidase [Anaerolineaceae bacterium]